MRTVAGAMLWVTMWAVAGLAVRLVANGVTGAHDPLWSGVVMGVGAGLGTALMGFLTNKGWLRGIFRDPRRVQELRERAARLEQERADLIGRPERG